MGDAKALVQALSHKPFSKSLTLIQFDALEPLQLLQTLNDVFTVIDAEHAVDIKDEDPADTVVRMLALLRAIKYKPEDGNLQTFRQGLIAGDKDVVYPILKYILPEASNEARIKDFQKRVYLGRFLTTVDVPPQMMQNAEVAEANDKYLELVEEFKEAHRELDKLHNSGFSASDVKKDIQMMESEKKQLKMRIGRMKAKTEGLANHQELLDAARTLRKEHERETSLASQRDDQTDQLNSADNKLRAMQTRLRDIRSNAVAGGAEGLLSRLEDEEKMNAYLCNDKLPTAIADRKNAMAEMARILDEPAMTYADLDQLRKRVQELTTEYNRLIEKRMVSNNPAEDKLSLFRQQASIIVRKKEATAENLQELQDELAKRKEEVEKKKKESAVSDRPAMLKADEFKVYVAKLRTKSTDFKSKKQRLGELRAEHLALSRTIEILKDRDASVEDGLLEIEASKGVMGAHATQDKLEHVSAKKMELDEQKGKTLDEMSGMVDELQQVIMSKKGSLAPLIKELRMLRHRVAEIEGDYEEKKTAYDNMASGLASNQTRLEQEVKGYRDEVADEEGRFHLLTNKLRIMQALLKRAEQEMQIYTSGHTGTSKSLRDQYNKRILEQANLGKTLHEKQKYVQESYEPNLRQLDMWKDLQTLLDAKHASGGNPLEDLPGAAFEEEDRLVL